jgi:hypothetical protein
VHKMVVTSKPVAVHMEVISQEVMGQLLSAPCRFPFWGT